MKKRIKNHSDDYQKIADEEISHLEEISNIKLSSLTESLAHDIRITTAQLKIELLRRFREFNKNITPEQWNILNTVSENEGIIQRELGEKTGKDRPTISRILDSLQKKDYILRTPDPADRRILKLYLTPSGKKITGLFSSTIRDVDRQAFQGIAKKELEKLKEILTRVRNNLNA